MFQAVPGNSTLVKETKQADYRNWVSYGQVLTIGDFPKRGDWTTRNFLP